MGPYIIDFEAFQHGDEQFKIKEICVLDVDRPLAPLYVLYEADRSWDSLTSSEQLLSATSCASSWMGRRR